GYHRPCVVPPPGKTPGLTLYGVDLVRSADGRFRVLKDRTQAPSGMGYALENRTVMSRLLPSLFRDSHPHRLAPFFRRVRESLAGLAPAAGQADPRVVIMTPGPHNETYFEHLYLSNYLDYTLIEGANLTVRDGRVWLKSVSGLEPVDVILRRVDDYYCDPLELRPDSLLGVPGLVEAVRCGRVAIANPLGAGILESPSLMAFLPRLSRHLLGQELRLPSIATWWCGQQRELDYVLANLPTLVLRPITRSGSTSIPVFGDQLDAAGLAQWHARIQAQPHLYVAQEQLTPSTTPTLRAGRLYPHQGILRTFLAAGQNSYSVMPGGLTRVGETPGSRMVSNQAGAVSKDTWVLASEPEQIVTLLPTGKAPWPQMQETLPGAAAENLFWLARYAERAEDMIRLLRNIHFRRNETLQVADPVNQTVLEMLLCGLTQMSMTYPGFTGDGAQARLAAPLAELIDLISNRRRTGTLAANLADCLNASYAVRNLMSADTRRVFNDIGDELSVLAQGGHEDLQPLQDNLDRIITALMAIAGAAGESMSRDLGWHFLILGRRIERALLLIALLRSVLTSGVAPEVEVLLLESVLTVAESFTLYRRRIRNRPELEATLDLLLLDENNSRSLVYQLNSARQHLAALPGQERRPYKREMRLLMEAATQLKLANADELAETENGTRPRLDTLLAGLAHSLSETSNALTATYFTHAQRPYQLVEEEP
ncbi:MAG: circularly permuted type 2 ATP-grasp protein, partial [Gammaproteobacteria bacterium]